MSDNLRVAARRRSLKAFEAVEQALEQLRNERRPITVASVARVAGVSRNYIYSVPAAFKVVDEAMKLKGIGRGLSANEHGRSSDESLRTRLAAAIQKAQELEEDNMRLRERNSALIAEVMSLQNPKPENVTPIRRRRAST